jgi:lambda family phage minor tail protein L
LEQDAIVEVFVLDYGHLVGAAGDPQYMLHFTDSVATNGMDVAIGGETYMAIAAKFDGATRTTKGAQSRPTLEVGEGPGGVISGLAHTLDDMKNAILRKKDMYRRNLDDGDDPDPTAWHYPSKAYIVYRKAREGGGMMVLELAAKSDTQGVTLPLGRVEHDYCEFIYGPERTALDRPLCSWDNTAGPWYDGQNQPVGTVGEDTCSHNAEGCKLRFKDGAGQPLDFGGLIGARRLNR